MENRLTTFQAEAWARNRLRGCTGVAINISIGWVDARGDHPLGFRINLSVCLGNPSLSMVSIGLTRDLGPIDPAECDKLIAIQSETCPTCVVNAAYGEGPCEDHEPIAAEAAK